MSVAQLPFSKRVKRIGRKHSRMAHAGVIHSVNHDGLIVARPRRRAPSFPWKGLVLLLVAALLFKSFLLLNLGPITYQDRVNSLAGGGIAEQAGAFVMQAGPASTWVVEQIRPYLP
jgi:hypothetical protein